MKINLSNKNRNIVWAVLFIAALALTFWRISFGYVSHDEAFFITIPDRLLSGDALFIDEWQPTQLTYFITLPFVALYKLIVGSNNGICLYMRYVYIIAHALVAAVIYQRLKKFGFLSIIASVLFFMFVPGDLMSPGYDSIGVDMVALSGVLFATAPESSHKELLFAVSGFAFALAVLCCPYLAAVYALYFVAVLICNIKKISSSLFNFRAFLFVTIGIALPAAAFLIFALSRASLSSILANLKYLLMDPEHQDYSFLQKFPRYFSSIILNSAQYFWIVCVLYALELIAIAADKNRMQHRCAYFIASLLLGTAGLIIFALDLINQYFTHIMFPLVIPGFTAYILLENKPKELFYGLFVYGILYSVCIYTASNQAFFVISMAFAVSNLAGYIFIGLLLKELSRENNKFSNIAFLAAAVCILTQAFLQTDVKLNHIFRDAAPSQLTSVIESGPMAGIRTTEDNSSMYNIILADLDYYHSKPSGNLLILAKQPWYYLAADTQKNASYSACIPGEYSGTTDMLSLYYAENPDKIPDYIYLPKYLSWDYDELLNLIETSGYSLAEENIVSYKFELNN